MKLCHSTLVVFFCHLDLIEFVIFKLFVLNKFTRKLTPNSCWVFLCLLEVRSVSRILTLVQKDEWKLR